MTREEKERLAKELNGEQLLEALFAALALFPDHPESNETAEVVKAEILARLAKA